MAPSLSAKIASNTRLILDGAMGTELHRRGVDIGSPLWSANALISHPGIVLQIHKDYIEAGANIITTNTFRTTRRAFSKAHLPDRSEELTRTAVDLAKEARSTFPDREILIAGSIAPLEDCYSPELVPDESELYDEHARHASRLAGNGVNFLLLETMNTIREAYAACEASKVAGKEVVVSFVCRNDGRLLSGESLADAVAAIGALKPSAFSVNCVSAIYMGQSLKELKKATTLPIMLYANVGSPTHGSREDAINRDVLEDDFTRHAILWREEGVAIVGGCCGTTPSYIHSLATALG